MRTSGRWVKNIALCMVMVMISSLMPWTGAFTVWAAGKTANISSATGLSAEAGSTITVPVNISDYSGIAGIGLKVTYDKEVLTPVSAEAAELTSDGVMDDSIEVETGNSFKIIWAQGQSENITAEGKLFDITFSVSEYAEGDTTIEFAGIKGDTFDEDFQTVTLNCTPAVVNVTPKAVSGTSIRSQSNQSCNDGEMLSVPIILDEPNGIQSLSYSLNYDTTVFEYDSFEGGIASEGGIDVTKGSDGLQVTVSGIPASASSGTLMVLKFKTPKYFGGNFLFDLNSDDALTQDFKVKLVNTHADESAIISGGEPVIDGTTLTVPIMISNNHGIAGFRFHISYDKDVLTPSSVTKNSRLKGILNNSIGDKEGTFDVLYTGTDNITGDGALISLVFTISNTEAAATVIGLDYEQGDTCDENLNDVALTMEDISVTLNGEPPANPVLTSIAATKTKTNYNVGDELNTDDITVTATYNDGTTKTVTGFTTNVADINMSSAGKKTLTASYTENGVTKTADIEITVTAVMQSISATKTKTDYYVGDELDTDDITVTAIYNDGSSKTVTGFTTNAADIDMSTAGTQTLTVSYVEAGVTKTADIEISVTEAPVQKALSSITAEKTKTNYNVGDELSIDDITVTAHYTDNSSKEVTGFTTNAADINMSSAGKKTLTVSYTEEGVTKTADIEINVTAVLESISATKTKTAYNVGDELDTDDITVTATYNDGSSKTVTGFTTNAGSISMSIAGSTTLTVSYTENGITKTADIEITLTAVLQSISAVKTKTDYYVGDELDTEDITVTATYNDGSSKTVTDFTTNAADIDMSTAGTQTLTVSYSEAGVTKTADIELSVTEAPVQKELSYITVEKVKTEYWTGDKLTDDDITVTAHYSDGSSSTAANYSTNKGGIDMSCAGTKLLTVAYSEGNIMKTADVQIIVTDFLKSISAVKIKTDYYVGDELDTDDIAVTASYQDGTYNEVTGFTTNAEEINMSEAGEKLLTVSYTESKVTRTTNIVITVTEVPVQKELSRITVEKTKTEFHAGEDLNLDDITVTAYYTDDSSNVVTDFTTNASEFNIYTPGTKTLTVSYTEGGITKTADIELNVIQVPLKSIRVEKTKTEYFVNSQLNIDDITITAEYEDGFERIVGWYYTNVEEINMAVAGEKTLTVTYSEEGVTKTASIIINVVPKLWKIEVVKTKTEYVVGDTLNTDDITVTAIYNDDSSRIVTDYTIDTDSIDMSAAGYQYLSVIYGEHGDVRTEKVRIYVAEASEPKTLSFIRAEKIKTDYKIGDELTTEDITVTAYYTDSSSRTVTDFTIDADAVDMSKTGEYGLIISYTENGFTTKAGISISVTAALQYITAEKIHQTVYHVGDALTISDLVVTAHYTDGSSSEVIKYTTNADEIDMSVAGPKTLTISYKEEGITKTADIEITVKALMLSVSAEKAKTDYYVGDVLNTDDITVTVSYNDGTTKEVTDYTTNADDIDMSTSGEKILTVSHREDNLILESNIVIKVTAQLKLISVSKAKTDYYTGDTLNVDDLIVKAKYTDNTEKEVQGYITNASDIDMTAAGTNTLTVSYTEGEITKTADITITVTVYEPPGPGKPELMSITVDKAKKSYSIGDTLTIDDLTVTATYSDDTTKVVSGYTTNAADIDMTTAGVKTLTVIYTEEGRTATASVNITVTATLSSLKAVKTKTDYECGDTLNIDDLIVLATYSDGNQKVVTDYTTNAADIDMSSAGNKTLTVSYTEGETTLNAEVTIKVSAMLTSLRVVKERTRYPMTLAFNTDDMVVTAVYSDGTEKAVTDYTTNAADIDTNVVMQQTLIVTYTENGRTASASVLITVVPRLTGLEATKTKTDFYVGDTINTDDIVVTATFSNGDVFVVEDYTTDADAISTAHAGTQIIHITYVHEGIPYSSEDANITITIHERSEEDQKAADAVIETIKSMDPSDRESVEAARAAYDALTEEQKALIDAATLKILTDAEAAIHGDDKKDIAAEELILFPEVEWNGGEAIGIYDNFIFRKEDFSRLYAGTDYEVTYTNNKELGTATAIITGIGNYKGEIKTTFEIVPYDMSIWLEDGDEFAELAKKSFIYNGSPKAVKLLMHVSLPSDFVEGEDYEITYPNGSKTVGAHKAVIKCRGNYSGSGTFKFKIVPKGTTISRLKAGSRSFTATWKKQATQTSGYQIRYSLKSSMKSAKTVKVAGAKKTSTTIKGLKAKKYYYVQVRTYKTVKGKKYCSSWSKPKKIKTK